MLRREKAGNHHNACAPSLLQLGLLPKSHWEDQQSELSTGNAQLSAPGNLKIYELGPVPGDPSSCGPGEQSSYV